MGAHSVPVAVFYDLGGTLLAVKAVDTRTGTERLLSLARNPRGVTVDEVEARASALWAELDRRAESSMLEVNGQGFQRLVYDAYGLSFDLSPSEMLGEFWRAAYDMEPAPFIREALETLANAGVRLAVVSNYYGGEAEIRSDLGRFGLLDRFEFVMSSADYVVRKPHPEIFRVAAARMGVRVSEAWYVGDSLRNDMEGAQSAGMHAAWYRPDGNEPEESSPYLMLRDHRDLPKAFGLSAT